MTDLLPDPNEENKNSSQELDISGYEFLSSPIVSEYDQSIIDTDRLILDKYDNDNSYQSLEPIKFPYIDSIPEVDIEDLDETWYSDNLDRENIGNGIAQDSLIEVPESWSQTDDLTDYDSFSSAYEAISDTLLQRKELSNIRFFEAAEQVTGFSRLGGIEVLHSIDVVSDGGLEFMHGLSRHLYETINLPQALKLVDSNGTLPSPDNDGSISKSPLDYDIRMVEIEQMAVEEYIREGLNSGKINQDDINVFNVVMNENILENEYTWAQTALGREVDLLNREDREAIGKAIIFQMHGLSQEDYLGHINRSANP